MERIAKEKAKAAAAQKKTSSSQTIESKIPADDDNDYDNLVS
jgi:hypothetical protein